MPTPRASSGVTTCDRGSPSWAAVNGRHVLRFEERLDLDVWYVEHQDMALDLRIMAMTIGQVLSRRHVSTTQDPASIGFPLSGGSVAVDPARAGAEFDEVPVRGPIATTAPPSSSDRHR